MKPSVTDRSPVLNTEDIVSMAGVDAAGDECDECAGLPEGVSCWACYQDGAAFDREYRALVGAKG